MPLSRPPSASTRGHKARMPTSSSPAGINQRSRTRRCPRDGIGLLTAGEEWRYVSARSDCDDGCLLISNVLVAMLWV